MTVGVEMYFFSFFFLSFFGFERKMMEKRVKSICRPIFNDLVVVFHYSLSLSASNNGVCEMYLFTPQSVAIEDTWKWMNRKWNSRPLPKHSQTNTACTHHDSYFSFFDWMWNILCHIYSIVFPLKVSLYDTVYLYGLECRRLCACLCVTKHENK